MLEDRMGVNGSDSMIRSSDGYEAKRWPRLAVKKLPKFSQLLQRLTSKMVHLRRTFSLPSKRKTTLRGRTGGSRRVGPGRNGQVLSMELPGLRLETIRAQPRTTRLPTYYSTRRLQGKGTDTCLRVYETGYPRDRFYVCRAHHRLFGRRISTLVMDSGYWCVEVHLVHHFLGHSQGISTMAHSKTSGVLECREGTRKLKLFDV